MREYNLYVNVIPSHGLEVVSYAQDFLVKKIEERKLRSFCMNANIAHTDLYRMAIGTRQPGYYIMTMLRFIIPPIWWFVEIDSKLIESVSIKEWVAKGFAYQPIYCLKKGKINNITFTRMQEFSSHINVQDWFVFLS